MPQIKMAKKDKRPKPALPVWAIALITVAAVILLVGGVWLLLRLLRRRRSIPLIERQSTPFIDERQPLPGWEDEADLPGWDSESALERAAAANTKSASLWGKEPSNPFARKSPYQAPRMPSYRQSGGQEGAVDDLVDRMQRQWQPNNQKHRISQKVRPVNTDSYMKALEKMKAEMPKRKVQQKLNKTRAGNVLIKRDAFRGQ